MPRNYNLNENSGGTNMVGRAYTPQVTPWERDSDDVSVQRSLRDDHDMRTLDRDYDYRARSERYDRDNDAYYRRDLVPGYGDERRGYQNSGSSEREDRHRAGHRAHWENRDPDYRYQYNDYRRADAEDMRRENQARYGEHRPDMGYRRENDRETWTAARNRDDYSRENYDRDRYNNRERYYAEDRDHDSWRDDDRGRWNRR
jgi:hypothetical protein